jgi:hypothetical protein
LLARIEHDLAFPFFGMGDIRATAAHAGTAAELAARLGDRPREGNALAQLAVTGFLFARGLPSDLLQRALGSRTGTTSSR